MTKRALGLGGLLGIAAVIGLVAYTLRERSSRVLTSSEPAFLAAREVSDLYSVLMVKGPIRVRQKSSGGWRNVSLTTPIYNGEIIETGPGAYVDLLLGERNYVRIGENTSLELTGRKEEGLRRYLIELADGKLGVVARHLAGFELAVSTRTSTVGVRGTSFMVEASRYTTVVSVLEGSVRVASRSAPDRPIQLGPMQEVEVARDQPPEPRLIPESHLEKLGVLERMDYFKPAKPEGAPGTIQKAGDVRRRTGLRQRPEIPWERNERRGLRDTERGARESEGRRLSGRRGESGKRREAMEGRRSQAAPTKGPAGRAEAGAPRPPTAGSSPERPAPPVQAESESSGTAAKSEGSAPADESSNRRAPENEIQKEVDGSEEMAAEDKAYRETAKTDSQLERVAIIQWVETCRVEIEALTPGRCFASAGTGFQLQGVRSDLLPDRGPTLSADDLRGLMQNARAKLKNFTVTATGVVVNVEGSAAFVSFDLQASGVKKSTGETISERHAVLIRLQKSIEAWRPLWARLV